ncbi:MAG: 1-deoxy-D-xylulose-5-phosphate synthase [Lachnospiraceae bacterium]|nr:1-deoxy-D-xylulose-5-phosphate synthase [Lachnospiraceae bacterium]
MKWLDRINKTGDIKNIPRHALGELAQEIREYLVDTVSVTGGHLASGLGAVELTMALHLALDLPEDKIVWDVGHQSYPHKILSGRKEEFRKLRTFDGISGFPKPGESDCDAFATGHASTSVSAALGLCRARDIKGTDETIVAVIGDGAMTGGMAYEALNDASTLKSNLVIILNDNRMSISENVGGLSKYLSAIRTRKGYGDLKDDVESRLLKIPGIGKKLVEEIKKSKDGIRQFLTKGDLFEDLGINYIGPIDGHNIEEMERAITAAARYNRAVLIHAITKKGKGYAPAESDPSTYHGIGAFDKESGKVLSGEKTRTYTDIFGATMVRMAGKNERIAAVCAAMPYGTGLNRFAARFPDRFFDVGIAEEHAVTMAAGMAAGGLKPYVAIYSTFLQRAYDQIIHDVCMERLNVTFCVDRGGIVGRDGETHQGLFDLSYLSSCPNMTVMAPKNKFELYDMLRFTEEYGDGPIAVRYPRGDAYDGLREFRAPVIKGKAEVLKKGSRIALLAVGSMVRTAMEVSELLSERGEEPTVVNMRFVKPMDEEVLKELAAEHDIIVTMEENVLAGGMGEHIDAFYEREGITGLRVLNIAAGDMFVRQGSPEELSAYLGLDKLSIFAKILNVI